MENKINKTKTKVTAWFFFYDAGEKTGIGAYVIDLRQKYPLLWDFSYFSLEREYRTPLKKSTTLNKEVIEEIKGILASRYGVKPEEVTITITSKKTEYV